MGELLYITSQRPGLLMGFMLGVLIRNSAGASWVSLLAVLPALFGCSPTPELFRDIQGGRLHTPRPALRGASTHGVVPPGSLRLHLLIVPIPAGSAVPAPRSSSRMSTGSPLNSHSTRKSRGKWLFRGVVRVRRVCGRGRRHDLGSGRPQAAQCSAGCACHENPRSLGRTPVEAVNRKPYAWRSGGGSR